MKAFANAAKEKNNDPLDALHSVFDWLEIIVLSFMIVLFLITFVVRHSPVDGSSMVPTLQNKDILLISNIGYTPQRGDIIVVQDDGDLIGLNEPLVKRVIAVGGDTVDINFDTWTTTVTTADGEIIVYENEPYVNHTTAPMRNPTFSLQYPVHVEEGHLFVMGDNRNGSTDSRDGRVGILDERYVVGHVLFRIFPLNRFGSLLDS